MAIVDQEVDIPKPLTSGATDHPDAQQSGTMTPPPDRCSAHPYYCPSSTAYWCHTGR